jgi:eukaryotic-like serine/threonine-protein kinase
MTTPQVLGERYEIGGVLGRGGMAEVHRGRDLRLGREVAVKVLRHDLARDPSFQVRFRREAQASASLNHPAIVAVYDTGEDRTATGATPYIVMEYVEGETLRDVLRREGQLTPERAMALSADICGALDFSHRNGIVHRDVKPGNVMITPQGTVKVMDFGIARAVSDSAATMTSTAAVIGTAQYLSPEQARGEGVDARSDVYSMGCVLFELVTGAPPFTGDSPVSVAYQHVREDPRLPSSINPNIPPELDAIVLKAMSKNPANRYQSAAEMRNDLLRALAGQRVEATPVMGDAEKTTILAATPGGPGPYGGGYGDDGWDDDEAARKRKRRIIAIVAVVVALLVAGAIALAIAMSGGGEEQDAPPAQVEVPGIVGQTVPAATKLIEDAGLTVGTVTTQASPAEQEGLVTASTPAPGALADPETPVNLVVGSGPGAVAIPGVVGLDVEQAESNLGSAGFTRVTIDRVDSAQPEGEVISVDPEAGSEVPLDTAITLEVSDGDVAVPDVRGQDQATALQTLRAAGFSNITPETVDAPEAEGTALGTSPAAGNQASADTAITLQVSGGPAAPAEPTEATVPDVRGLTEAAARRALASAGFTSVSVTTSDENDPGVEVGQAIGTEPPAGTTEDLTTTISLLLNPPA